MSVVRHFSARRPKQINTVSTTNKLVRAKKVKLGSSVYAKREVSLKVLICTYKATKDLPDSIHFWLLNMEVINTFAEFI